MRARAMIRLLFMMGAITWLGLVFTDIVVLISIKNSLEPDIPVWLPKLLLNLFILSLFYYYKFKIEHDEVLNFIDLLWRVFATGLIATVISLALRLVSYLLGNTKLPSDVVYIDLVYLINIGLMISFLIMAFTAWKRLILYQKSKWLLRFWAFFEYGLLISLLYDSFNCPRIDWLYIAMLVTFLLAGLVRSGTMKCVAYLSFRQKWTGLLLLLLTIFYLLYGFYTSSDYAGIVEKTSPEFADYRDHVFILSLISFVT